MKTPEEQIAELQATNRDLLALVRRSLALIELLRSQNNDLMKHIANLSVDPDGITEEKPTWLN
ncbi:MAG: hypothetical protein DMG80_12025 [Acidobacteria bacterium]|nr:MAG: hypothetical protein DMG80_12025 [Acidobacteriota bacterium]